MELYKKPNEQSYTVIKVLPDLSGQPWDDLSKNMLMAVRPSYVRESWGEIKCDACCWRVTVYLRGSKDEPIVDYIEQEVAVGSVGADNGHDLDCKLKARQRVER